MYEQGKSAGVGGGGGLPGGSVGKESACKVGEPGFDS